MPEQQDGADLLVQAMRQAFEDTFEQDQPPKDKPAPPLVESHDPPLDNEQRIGKNL